MIAPIVAGIDGSAHAWRALDWAVDLACLHRLPLVLVHASRGLVSDGTFSDTALAHLRGERAALLDDARRYALRQSSGLDVSVKLIARDPGRALVDEGEGGPLVVVGSRGLGGFEGLLFGSVGLHVAAHARCPVLVVPKGAATPAESPAEIVVGIGGRRPENHVLDWAFREAARRGARLVAVHATGAELGSPHERLVEDKELSEALAGWVSEYPDVRVTPLVADGTPARALVAASAKAALVVVGARDRKEHFGMALGRTNHAVLHHARCPIAVVPEK